MGVRCVYVRMDKQRLYLGLLLLEPNSCVGVDRAREEDGS
jgi:RNA binding exosome subunit